MTPSHFLSGERCVHCKAKVISEKQMRTHSEFCSIVEDLVKKEYSVMSKYNGAHQYVIIKHNICGKEYEVKANNFLSGKRCPICNESKGEKSVRTYLERNDILFETEFAIDDCKRTKCLPFDFAIFDQCNKNKLIFLIEYDGLFHYEPARYSKDKSKMLKKLQSQQKNDQLKNEYCINNNIPLLRIPYWDFDNIEPIIEEYICKLDNINHTIQLAHNNLAYNSINSINQ